MYVSSGQSSRRIFTVVTHLLCSWPQHRSCCRAPTHHCNIIAPWSITADAAVTSIWTCLPYQSPTVQRWSPTAYHTGPPLLTILASHCFGTRPALLRHKVPRDLRARLRSVLGRRRPLNTGPLWPTCSCRAWRKAEPKQPDFVGFERAIV